jgi:hypothetical protein
MNPFTKQWLTSTVAPESIVNIKQSDDNYLDCVKNESNTIKVFILSNKNKIIAIGKDYQSLLNSSEYSFKDGLCKIAELLKLRHYKT